jgi:shikimate kinase
VNLVLTGFMGAGKSTTGKRLAKLLRLPFIDTDAEIERRHGAIADVFASKGEAAFRAIESQLIDEIVRSGPAVIAVGGGAVLDPANRVLLRRSSYVVHLWISARGAHRRVARRRHRPLLGETPTLETVASLLAARKNAYADCDFVVRVDRQRTGQTAQIIADWYAAKRSEARA